MEIPESNPGASAGNMDLVRRILDSNRLVWAVKALLAALAAYFTGAFLYIALSRIGYRFTLEWLEGASLVQVQRIISGGALYAQPSFDYVALIYSPLYFYLSALFAKIFGFGFLPLRLVSLLSTLGCTALIYLIVRRRTKSTYISLMAAASFLALYKVSDTWFDLARVDMLALFFALLAIYLVEIQSAIPMALAGASISLAILTKQTYWILLIPFFIYAFSVHGARSLIVIFTAVLVSGISHLVLDGIYQGWYSFFVYTLGFGQGQSVWAGGLRHMVTAYWWDSVLKIVPVCFLFAAPYFLIRIRPYMASLGMLALAAGMILISWLGILNKGGYNNVLLPSFAIFIILSWLFVGEMLKNERVSNLARIGVLLIYGLQLLYLLYPIAPQIPTREDFATGESVVASIREQPGDVYIPFDNYLALYAGKKPFAGFGSLGDLNAASGDEAGREWKNVNGQYRALIKSHDFSLILLDENAEWGSAERYYESYYQASEMTYSDDSFFPVAGWQIRPKIRYTPIGAN